MQIITENMLEATVVPRLAWKSPTVSYIDIKRTMSLPGGSLSDLNLAGSASTDQA